jgi:hypothetical protein
VVLPRRVRDFEAEDNHYKRHGKKVLLYRKVQPDEEDRAEPFPVLTAGVKTFAQFGIGIGIYFMQLLVLSCACLICGFILIVAIREFNKPEYGITSSSNPFVPISAACASPVNVTVTVNCPNGESECLDLYRPNCELPFNAAVADLVMSILFLTAIVLSKFLESAMIEELDEAVQTAQDYSVAVNDPNPDADNPDEWYEFFSRFGKVRYVTITRKNKYLTQLVLQKHKFMKKATVAESQYKTDKKEYYLKKMAQIDTQLEAAYTRTYPTCRVYVTYETEEAQRLCLQELEVPDIAAILDLKSTQPRKMFRGNNVLDVCEPPEPDSVLWENVETERTTKMMLGALGNLISLASLVACYFLISSATTVSPVALSLVIAAADAFLPILFEFLTDLGSPESEGSRQSNLQVRLFLARFLLSTLFPYLQTSWNSVLDADFISQVVSVQIAASFVTPIISFFDIGGVVTRNVLGPLSSDSQGELNSHWMGSNWSLAERYTGVAKILFVSLYYTLLNPIALLIAMVAFLLVFLIDRFLLFRRWKPVCMLDSKIARRLRQQGILAIALHMAVTTRFIYSWPMDNVYERDDGQFERVDKYPPIQIWLVSSKDWMSDGQADVLRMYRITTVLVCIVAIYIWIIDPLFRSFFRLFCYSIDTVGDPSDIAFTQISKTPCYVPTTVDHNEQYMCSYVKDMLPKNKPSLLRPMAGDFDDLSGYVPAQYQSHVLSIVKYYGDRVDDSFDKIALGLGLGADVDAEIAKDMGNGDVVASKFDTNTHPRELHVSTTTTLSKYVTNADGVLEPVARGMPEDLMSIIGGSKVPRQGRQSERSQQPQGEAELRNSINLSPEDRRKRRMRGNVHMHSEPNRQFHGLHAHRHKINPLPAIGADAPDSPDQMSAKPNRVILRPISLYD